MLTLDEIILRLRHRRMGIVCAYTSLHPNTVRAVMNGTKKPCYDTLIRLNQYLQNCP